MPVPHTQSIATLQADLAHASPAEIIAAAKRAVGPERLAVVSSFGTESAALLKYVAEVDPSLPVLFLDTGWLFKETLAYRDKLATHLGLRDVRTLTPSPSALVFKDSRRDLCFTDPDACCGIRKVDPLAAELASFDAWINGRKRFHGGERGAIPVVEADGTRLKFNPLARASESDVEAAFRDGRLPRHPLEALGYQSVGCAPCTARPSDNAARGGRWSGMGKTECGIHTSMLGRAARQAPDPALPLGTPQK